MSVWPPSRLPTRSAPSRSPSPRHSAKREALLAAGANKVIATDQEDLLKSVAGVDIILDTVRGPGFAELAEGVKLGGTVISVGWSDPRPPTYRARR